MSKLNFLVFLQTYSDSSASNSPSLSNFRWSRNVDGLSVNNPISQAFVLAPGESRTLFDGTRTLSHDGTTQYSLTLKPLSLHTFCVSGSLPNFELPGRPELMLLPKSCDY